MKFIIAILLTALLAFVLGLYLPWWEITFAAFIVAALVPQGPLRAWFSAFLGLFLLWGILAWWIDIKNQGILSKKMAAVFPLGGSSFLLILITALIGAIVAGFAALSGCWLRKSKVGNR